MPRDGAGIYTLPPGYQAVTGQTILASQHNPPFEDVAAALTGSLPRNGSAGMLAALPMGGFTLTGLGPGVEVGDSVSKGQMDTAIAAAVAALTALIITIPPGIVAPYAGGVVPPGWILCDGLPVSRTTYAALFAAIGTRFGAGDGSTTFNTPQVQGDFLRFWDYSRGVDPGRQMGSEQSDSVGPHIHPIFDPGHAHSNPAGAVAAGVLSPGGAQGFADVTATNTTGAVTGISVQPNTGTTETRPRNICFTGIIKV